MGFMFVDERVVRLRESWADIPRGGIAMLVESSLNPANYALADMNGNVISHNWVQKIKFLDHCELV